MTEGETTPIEETPGTFLTGVDIDVDQWRAQTIEELQGWLDDLKSKKTEYGDPLVEFPEDWNADDNLSPLEQLDFISKRLSKDISGSGSKEAQNELQLVRVQAEKLKKLEAMLNSMGADSDDEQVDPEYEDILGKEIEMPKISTGGPNPFELNEDLKARLREIDEKLGTQEEAQSGPVRSIDDINNDLLSLYKSDQS